MSDLTWGKAKDALLIAALGGLVTFLGILANGQSRSNEALASVQRDIAVLLSNASRDQKDHDEFKDRLKALEGRK